MRTIPGLKTTAMKLALLLWAILTGSAACTAEQGTDRDVPLWSAPAGAPLAATVNSTRRIFSTTIVDEYAWLRAPNWTEVLSAPEKLPPAIRAHIADENHYSERSLAPVRRLRSKLIAEMRARIESDTSSVPLPDGPWEYFERHVSGREHPLYFRRLRSGGKATLLLDSNLLARGQTTFELAGARHSPDHAYLAYAYDTGGAEDYTIRIRDLASGRDLPDVIANAEDLPEWAADSRTLLYARRRNGKALTIMRHTLGSPSASDAVVHEEADPAFLVTLGKTSSGRYILITAANSQTEEVRVVDAQRPADTPRVLIDRRAGERHEVEHVGERFIIRTNADGKRDFRIVETPVTATARAQWREVVAHREGKSIELIHVTARHLVRIERRRAQQHVVVRRMSDGAEHEIDIGPAPSTVSIVPGDEFDTNVVRLTHETMSQPRRTYDYDMETRQLRLRKTQRIPSGHAPSRYTTELIWAPARDGELIPITLLYRRGLKKDGRARVFLHGYGAYGVTTESVFDPNVLSLIRRGFVYAIAHVRGGSELGARWRDAGMLRRKLNSFNDFIDAAAYLTRSGYTAPGGIVAYGMSAGGLLVGGAVNMRPDLFMGVIAQAPFVDVTNTMLDPTLPLTPAEWTEWGNPAETKEALETILAYSPYDNVRRQLYPPMLVTSSLTDPRVTYWEPVKWVARLRARKLGEHPVLLVTSTASGHDGPTGRFEKLRMTAMQYAFAITLARRPMARPAP